MPHEVQGLLAVQKNGGSCCPVEPSCFNLDAPTRAWDGLANGLQLYFQWYRLVRIDRHVLLGKLVSVVAHHHLMCTDVEPDGPVAGTNGLAVDKGVSLLGSYRHPQFP